jgi:hypothetical protein
MKSFGTRYVARNTRVAAMPSGFKGLSAVIRRGFLGLMLIGIFAVSVNLLVKHMASSVSAIKAGFKLPGIKLPEMSLPFANMMSEEKFLVDDGQEYVVGSNGKFTIAPANTQGKYLVRLIGISADEKREEYVKVFRQALAIDRKYLALASDINMRNCKNIIMITTDGATVYFGDSITKDKLENFMIAAEKIKETGKKCTTMNLTYDDMVIIK